MNTVKVLGEFFFSQLLDKAIHDSTGRRIGRVMDMAVHWDGVYPRVIGLKYAKKNHGLIPVEMVESCDKQGIRLAMQFTDAITIPLQDEDIYISKWLLDKQIIDLKGSKLVRVNDITLSWVTQDNISRMFLSAVDIGVRGLFRRLGLDFLFKNYKNNLLGWQYIKPLETRSSDLQLTREKQQLDQLHPADIADLVEEMDYRSRADFIDNLDSQQALEALAEMDLDTQVEIIEQMDEQRASDILEEMPPDEAADILGELPEEKSRGLLNLMEVDEAEEVRELMQYDEGTAGALMTTEFLSFSSHLTAEQVINTLRELAPDAETIYYLYVTDEAEHLQGVLSLRELIVSQPQVVLQDIMHTKVVTVRHNDNYQRVADVIHKYGLLAAPVVDEQNVLLGIITVDDIFDIVMPERGKAETYSWFASRRLGRGW